MDAEVSRGDILVILSSMGGVLLALGLAYLDTFAVEGWRWRLFNVVTMPIRLALWLTIIGPFVVAFLGCAVLDLCSYIVEGGDNQKPWVKCAAAWWTFWTLQRSPWD